MQCLVLDPSQKVAVFRVMMHIEPIREKRTNEGVKVAPPSSYLSVERVIKEAHHAATIGRHKQCRYIVITHFPQVIAGKKSRPRFFKVDYINGSILL